jgi:hypothetical protein
MLINKQPKPAGELMVPNSRTATSKINNINKHTATTNEQREKRVTTKP